MSLAGITPPCRPFTVIELEVLLHYYCSPYDWSQHRTAGPASNKAIERLLRLDLLNRTAGTALRHNPEFVISERGKVLVKALLETPLPVRAWVMG